MTVLQAQSDSRAGGVSLRSLVLWTFAFIVWGILRQKFGDYAWQETFQRIGILEATQVYFIGLLAMRIDPDLRVPAPQALVALSMIATLVLLLRFRPAYASGGLELGLLALSLIHRSIRLVAWAITLFVFQYLFLSGPFLWLHEIVGGMDAAVLRASLAELGYRAAGFGPFVFIEGSEHGVNVMGACSTSNIVGTIVAGYCIIVLGRRGRLVPDDAVWLAGLVSGAMAINWLRLAPMALSMEGHQFWHDGLGASLVSLLFAAIVMAAAFRATRPAGKAPA